MARSQVFRLQCDSLTHLSVARVVTRAIHLVTSVATLLQGCERLVVTLRAVVSDLDLVEIRRPLFGDKLLMSTPHRDLVGSSPLVGFKLIALFKTHFEVVLALRRYLLL
jgi:hypothetical protein